MNIFELLVSSMFTRTNSSKTTYWLINPVVWNSISSLTLFRMGFFGAAHGLGRWGGLKGPSLWNLWHISYNDEAWHSYTLPKEDLKNIWITWHALWILLTSGFFHCKSANFAISRNTDIYWILKHNFQFF